MTSSPLRTGNPSTCEVEKCDANCEHYKKCRQIALGGSQSGFDMAEAIAEAQKASLGSIVFDDFHGE